MTKLLKLELGLQRLQLPADSLAVCTEELNPTVSYCLVKFGQDVMSAHGSARREDDDLNLRSDLLALQGSI